jgi:hypothetical protein
MFLLYQNEIAPMARLEAVMVVRIYSLLSMVDMTRKVPIKHVSFLTFKVIWDQWWVKVKNDWIVYLDSKVLL